MSKTFTHIIPNATNVIRSSSHHANYTPTNHVHRNEHYEILVIKKGGGTHSIDFNEYEVKDNHVFFLRPGQMHQFSPTNEAEFYFIAIDNESIQLNANIALSKFSFFSSLYAQGSIHIKNIEPVITLITSIQKELHPNNKHKPNQDIIISSYLVILLIHIGQLFQEKKKSKRIQSKHSDLVHEFKQSIDHPTKQYRFVADVAKTLFVTPNYLNEKVKKRNRKTSTILG